ncbi:MAG: hypothetical protein GXO86_09975 [Chlorobi bacterium]|nr:hypothetical protein [Chlorobiota bacterium]
MNLKRNLLIIFIVSFLFTMFGVVVDMGDSPQNYPLILDIAMMTFLTFIALSIVYLIVHFLMKGFIRR